MMNNSSARLIKTVKLMGAPLILAILLTGCGTKEEAAGLHQTGTVAFMLNCDESAATYFKKALDANPEFGPSYIMLGDCYLREGKNQEAVDIILKGFEMNLDEGQERLAHRKLARAYKELGQPEKALEHITIYTRMSVYQEKFSPQKLNDTERFVAELPLPEGHEVVSVSKIMEDTIKARESSKTAKDNESSLLDMFDIM
ncbi:Tetratricopeptide repeat-containing protein [Maridesulfovibrio ferrireducens]|uniref:Tetratricopeptide repeat-containing protein n=1 Tax=Maridesulfovibrio ferrireducens TaxID=246191 RepID=A0A1G9LJ38_9BACT|nr:tetratricopeptide repeat protein [Maridesulfovibrio ferrireducens]SDL61961.1 Tetratricopeptide repeat-containing protein [Maridesulfovibrio ferrireducens]